MRLRTLGCYPLTGAVESTATDLPQIIQEMLMTRTSERQGRIIDHDQDGSMEKKKIEGYSILLGFRNRTHSFINLVECSRSPLRWLVKPYPKLLKWKVFEGIVTVRQRHLVGALLASMGSLDSCSMTKVPWCCLSLRAAPAL